MHTHTHRYIHTFKCTAGRMDMPSISTYAQVGVDDGLDTHNLVRGLRRNLHAKHVCFHLQHTETILQNAETLLQRAHSASLPCCPGFCFSTPSFSHIRAIASASFCVLDKNIAPTQMDSPNQRREAKLKEMDHKVASLGHNMFKLRCNIFRKEEVRRCHVSAHVNMPRLKGSRASMKIQSYACGVFVCRHIIAAKAKCTLKPRVVLVECCDCKYST